MTYDEIVYAAFLDELEKQARFGTNFIPAIKSVVTGAKSAVSGASQKAMYNPVTMGASSVFTRNNGDLKSMGLDIGTQVAGKALNAAKLPKVSKAVSGVGNALTESFRALPAS